MSAPGETEGALEEISLSEPNQDEKLASAGLANGHHDASPVELAVQAAAPTPAETTPTIPQNTPNPAPVRVMSTSITSGQGQTLSTVLVTSALKTIAASKEAKRSQQLREAVDHALDMLNEGKGGDKPREIFEPLRLACETHNEKLLVASLDCISKLISYAFFVENASPQNYTSPPGSPTASAAGLPTSLADLVTHTITSCYTESTSDAVSLQIVKALLQIVLSPHILVHHSSLLKAVRTVYNIFLLSQSPMNQNVAQGGLTQMVHHIFARTQISTQGQGSVAMDQPPSATQSTFSLSTPTVAENQPVTPVSAQEEPKDDVERAAGIPLPPEEDEEHEEGSVRVETPRTGRMSHTFTTRDLFIKDAFLVFRALCKLTMKPLPPESERDLKSHPMRSKLLSLHLVRTILDSHMLVFVSPSSVILSASTNEATIFVQAIKQYLCLSLSRNAVSFVPQVFEASVEIFWLVLTGMRSKLKREIEVLFNEIFIPILEMRTSSVQQKIVLVNMIQRLCQDPQALVEIYLNYDCDLNAVENIYERLMSIISKQSTAHYGPTLSKGSARSAQSPTDPGSAKPTSSQHTLPPSLTTTALSETTANADVAALERKLHQQSLESLVFVLKSLVAWKDAAGRPTSTARTGTPNGLSSDQATIVSRSSLTDETAADSGSESVNPRRNSSVSGVGSVDLRVSTPTVEGMALEDDPSRFESEKMRKVTLTEGIKLFNSKPKRGITYLLDKGFIRSKSPNDVAAFLLHADGLSKASIGEYLGEGEEENIATMHAFVDMMDLTNLSFTSALRTFLQAFRLPGEAQKIDRYMLKFADRYMAGNTDTPFANATAAYVLAYSTILLNTDAHNPQVKKRMTKQDFIKNNRGINDDADLPEDFLGAIYDDIQTNEIRMKDEVEAQLGVVQPTAGLANALANVGRDYQKEAYLAQSNGMANRTEALFRTMMRAQRRGKASEHFFSASHFVHVKPMFEVAWMSFLAGISGPLQGTDNMEVVELCLDGFKYSIRIAAFFDMELERNAFVTTLAKFTFLNNLGEMKTKNMEAIKALLDVALSEGDHLKGSWRDVLMCVSQLEHMQLIGSAPDEGKKGRSKRLPAEELANESRSTHITVSADMVFSLSNQLSGAAIVDFVQALSDVSWEEIQSSGLSDTPRLFSIRKLVEICYYNMNRIRLEWVNMWAILGEHFNQVCCHSNVHVSNFALDSLRQLAMRFLEKEELPSFRFQKDFLKPFQYTMIHNNNPESRDMVLQCLQQMIQARTHNLRSGWQTMFAVFSAASKVFNEAIANYAWDVVTMVNRDHFSAVVSYGSFADLTVCIADFCKLSKFQRISLVATSTLRELVPKMLKCPHCGFENPPSRQDGVLKSDDPMLRFWFPMLFSFVDIILNGEDLEVRRLALESFFGNLKTHGKEFPPEFWDIVTKELIFPIFVVLKLGPQDLSRFNSQEDMSVWISTTMIQALRDTIDLWTFHFTLLERFFDGLLDLLRTFICQENDTLARIGTSCLQQLLENNASKLSPQLWQKVMTTFVWLFKTTTPYQLLDERLRTEVEETPDASSADNGPQKGTLLPAPLSPPITDGQEENLANPATRKRIFALIITKCVLQLLLIETTHELLQSNEVYENIPTEHLLRLMAVLDDSYQFARGFNANKEVRNGLWRVGFMRHPPNLLKQESSSAATLVNVLLRIASDKRPEHTKNREEASNRLILLGMTIIGDFNQLKPEVQSRNISAWSPVVAEVLEGFSIFEDHIFHMYLPVLYPRAVDLLSKDISPEIRIALRSVLLRISPGQ
ncbi:probable SEC7-component of non-clathrin vesicle coat [Serendipita indica DSM 11827]|uniref:Probable SEC7-component of non-clathrin vesicle coat n=1 Tax=Serendipita indica (strain DSM 11827) TaxID=1109443 RepID=G4T5R1_SERID|nr:probable SEC7-component of non-clathrin vesicle coat [Serendipita indica DSM 11827]